MVDFVLKPLRFRIQFQFPEFIANIVLRNKVISE